MFDDAMFTPLPRPRVLFPFDGLQFAHSGNKQRMLIAGKRAAGRGNGDATRIGTGIGTGVGTGIGDPADEDSTKVWIFHSALLESDDEEGYRRFIGEVVDGTLAPVWPALL
jgi:hypothetical protein